MVHLYSIKKYNKNYIKYKTPIEGPLFHDNLGKSAPERLNQTLMKEEMTWWQWHHLNYTHIICTSL